MSECIVQSLITFHCETAHGAIHMWDMLDMLDMLARRDIFHPKSHLFLCECVIIDTPCVTGAALMIFTDFQGKNAR